MTPNDQKRSFLMVIGVFCGGLLLLLLLIDWTKTEPPFTPLKPVSIDPGKQASKPMSEKAQDARRSARSKIIGITNYLELSAEQLSQFKQVVSPGVSNFVFILQKNRVSRFDTQTLGPENFISLHDPKPGLIWDLKLQGNNGQDYFMRFNQTEEMGYTAAYTNVVSFFPMNGPGIQDAMEAFPAANLASGTFAFVENGSETKTEALSVQLSRTVLKEIGRPVENFMEIPTSTENSSGLRGGYVVAYRPKGLPRPDNALYDTTLGYIRHDKGLALDTFTHNSSRLVLPQNLKTPTPRVAVPHY